LEGLTLSGAMAWANSALRGIFLRLVYSTVPGFADITFDRNTHG
jgi:hypothetical protein